MASRVMRPILYSSIAFCLLAATPAGAQLTTDLPHPSETNAFPHPDTTRAEDWNAFCYGMEKEIQRQATEANNQLQFNVTQHRIDNLHQQLTDGLKARNWTGTNFGAWFAQGEKEAGKPLWDLEQLVNGDNESRATMRIVRQNGLSSCDHISDNLSPSR